MATKKTLCTETGLYKSFLDLMKYNTDYMKNMEKSYQNMYAKESTSILINCSKFFILSFNSFTIEEKIRNIEKVKNDLFTYELIIKVLVDLKILSVKQFSNLGLIISKIKSQISGFEKSLNDKKENS